MLIINKKLRDFRLPPRCKWDLPFCGILRTLIVWDGPTGCPETSVNTYQFTLRKIQNSEDLKHKILLFNCIWQDINVTATLGPLGPCPILEGSFEKYEKHAHNKHKQI